MGVAVILVVVGATAGFVLLVILGWLYEVLRWLFEGPEG